MSKLSEVVHAEGARLHEELEDLEAWGDQERTQVLTWFKRMLKHGATPPGYPNHGVQPKGQAPK